ncbi:MAG: DEAD/DEAH box helicase, partial [Ilumatobacter sp.]|nr:DEAD/DEAH box helicase [Ilumatobacter sp.]
MTAPSPPTASSPTETSTAETSPTETSSGERHLEHAEVVAALATATAALDDAEDRPGQVEMAELVDAAIASGRHLVVQAGTGTGKTLAYLLPAVRAHQKVVVATATKALQDQLAGKDLPFLDEHVGGFEWSVLKGRSNYVCRQRVQELLDDRQGRLDLPTDDPMLQSVLTWADATEIGDRAELPIEPRPSVWEAVSVTSQECPGAAKCPSGERCFAEAARARAAEADVVIVNTHLYGTHLAAGGVILAPHDVVVIDEAHRFEEVVSSTSGLELSAGRLTAAAYAIGRVLEDDISSQLLGDASNLGGLLDNYVGDRLDPVPKAIITMLTSIRGRLDEAAAALRKLPDDKSDVVARSNRAQTQITSLSIDLATVMSVPDTDVAWV